MKWLDRQVNLIGEQGLEKLTNTEITVFGIGGVGSYALETLVRTGVGRINIVDNDTIDPTNINRQLYALHSTVGMKKIDVAYNRCLDINPELNIRKYDVFIESKEEIENIIKESDYVLDCIDTIDSKIQIIEVAKKLGIPLISSMSAGNKLEPGRLQITDVFQTKTCPISKIMRKKLRDSNIENLTVVCSDEENKKINNEKTEISTVSYVPSVAGILMTSECIKDILKLKD